MTVLCPTCNGTIKRKHVAELEEDVIYCRTCKRYSVDNSGTWLTSGDMTHLRTLIKIRNEDEKRHKLMMESPITHPMWTDISPA